MLAPSRIFIASSLYITFLKIPPLQVCWIFLFLPRCRQDPKISWVSCGPLTFPTDSLLGQHGNAYNAGYRHSPQPLPTTQCTRSNGHSALSATHLLGTKVPVRALCVVPCAREPRRPPWASLSLSLPLTRAFPRLYLPVSVLSCDVRRYMPKPSGANWNQLIERDRMFIIWQPPKGENDDYNNENFWISG